MGEDNDEGVLIRLLEERGVAEVLDMCARYSAHTAVDCARLGGNEAAWQATTNACDEAASKVREAWADE